MSEQRVIKFRVWLKACESPTGRAIDAKMEYIDLSWFGDLHIDSVADLRQATLLQSTGLLDKHGKDVYEGDIVRCSSKRGCLHVMEWREEVPCSGLGGMPGFYLSGLNEGYVWMREEAVVGNIYEHPRLVVREV